MKINTRILIIVATVTLMAIIINQLFWMRNMYKSYQQELVLAVDASLEDAIFMEYSERLERLEGPRIFSFNVINVKEKDTSQIVRREVHTEDSTFWVEYNKNDSKYSEKIMQYLLHKDLPIDLDVMNSYLYKLLKRKGFPIRNTYVEYIDLKTHQIIKHNKPKTIAKIFMISTNVVPIDILNTIGVKAYVESSPRTIFKKMAMQQFLSILLIFISCYCLFYLILSFFRQQKIEQMRQDFVNAMIHEFKRPITNASSMMDLIPFYLEKKDIDKVDSYVNDSILELRKLTAYTDRIQRISNNDPERIFLNKELVAIKPFLENLKIKYASREDKVINLSVVSNTIHQVWNVDKLHFSNVVDNLMENAIKYSDNPVDIEVMVCDTEKGIELCLKDNGYGISDHDKKYIFDKFYRVNSSQTKRQTGFGLGLTYVKSIVEAHGGKIHVEDNPSGIGCVFIVFIPCVNDDPIIRE
jgi:two-component sensor histidine kinase